MADMVKAHQQTESMTYREIIGEHINRKEASQTVFNHAKTFLTKVYGGKRCIVCELRGEQPHGKIESHHFIEWCHWQDIVKAYGSEDEAMKAVEYVLRVLSPLIHGLYLASKEEILAGTIPTIWNHPELKEVPFHSLDDPRNQWFLCHAHHQQSTNAEIDNGEDFIGLHHLPIVHWILYMVLPKGIVPVLHNKHHEDGLDREV